MLKPDINKAFDSISCDALRLILEKFNIPMTFIQWLGLCYTSPSYSLLVNGSLWGFIEGRRGFRQGDPISPQLFVLIMEVLAGLLEEALSRKAFLAHPKWKSLKISHLSFADDVLLFFKGIKETVGNIHAIILQFTKITGLSISTGKSFLVTVGLNIEEAEEYVGILGCELANLSFTYWGIPLISGRLNSKECLHLLEKITDRIANWKNSFLSYAGGWNWSNQLHRAF